VAKSNHNYKSNVYLEGYVDNGVRISVPVSPEGAIIPPQIPPIPIIKVPSILTQQYISVLDTHSVGDLVSNDSFTSVPILNSQLILVVNGVDLLPANGSADVPNAAFYITDSTNSIVRTTGSYVVGDKFHWNGVAAGFELEAVVDTAILIYEITAP
jgi:hypothetical protein